MFLNIFELREPSHFADLLVEGLGLEGFGLGFRV